MVMQSSLDSSVSISYNPSSGFRGTYILTHSTKLRNSVSGQPEAKIMQKIEIVSAAEKFDLFARDYDKSTDNRTWDNMLLDVLGKVAGKSILDIGSGTGRLAAKLSSFGARVTGIDISEKMVEISSRRCLKNAEFIQSDVLDFKLSQPFDIVVSAFTFCYIEDKRQAFSRVFGFLEIGGIFALFATSQIRDTIAKSTKGFIAAPFFPNQPEDLSNLMEETGFVIDEWREIHSSGSPTFLLVKTQKPYIK